MSQNNIWFTSDTHFGHKNIIKLGKGRPFKDIDEHDHELIKKWNSVVKEGDTIYHLGDFSFCCSLGRTLEVLQQLKGTQKYVWGNHDENLKKAKNTPTIYGSEYHEFLGDYHYLRVPDETKDKGYQGIVLMHYPLVVWYKINKGVWHLHGHCHGGLNPSFYEGSPKMDVGVDVCNFIPISFAAVKEKLSKVEYLPVDHHDRSSS